MRSAQYLEILPGEQLGPFIKCFWIAFNDADQELTSSTLPDGCFELVISYQDHILRSISLFGMLAEPYEQVVMPPRELKLGIRLKPLGKEYYFDALATFDRFVEFTENLTGDLSSNLQAFAGSVSSDIGKQVNMKAIDRRKLLLFELLEKTGGNIDVAAIAEQCFWSSRQINRYLNKLLGMSLKSYCNILKCCASYGDIKAGHLNPALGFYDQSHFIREIRKHTGATPKTLLKNEGHRYLQFNDIEN